MPSPDLFLWDHPISSYAQKCRMALRFKSLPFHFETPANLGSGEVDSSFLSANPRMEVPALIVKNHNDGQAGEFKIFDSTAIMMYLEEAFPETPNMLPRDADSRAEARMIEELCDTHYEAINWAMGEIVWFKRAEGSEAERLVAAAKEQTGQILSWLAEKLGEKKFFNGDEGLGYADLCVAPFLNRSVINGMGPEKGSTLQRWHERVREVECVKLTFAEVEAAAPAMRKMGPEAWKKGSGRRREYRDHRLEWMVKNGAIGIVSKGLEDGNVRFSWPQPLRDVEGGAGKL
ncbi:hypothetical protein CERZMDRAFT_121961 [Cercospora zeae-maydis SCOH1-5]|uniref:GST N-terminal domain-containing protein n=1 Tax=Cercospora zeae-maydis SCOH1-5 TaxID=717836 RepID=A0A6A6F922_9PEZI|nr:hypothetical protein CERZMDRAFT_121961 [Cercospora zeae-maydis SCOH1-5]